MDRGLALFAIGLIFGGGIGFVIAAGNGVTFDGHDHADPSAHGGMQIDHAAMGHGGTDHEMMHDTPVEVAAGNAPSVAIMLKRDPMAGYNLHVMTDQFSFSPEGASLAPVPGQGHAHVYVNGKKLGRLYGEWMHIATLPKGEVTVEVTLNSNDHRPLAVGGAPISARSTLTVE